MTPKTALFLTWALLVTGYIGYAVAQQRNPANVNGCVVVGAAPTLTAGQQTTFTCNTAGQLRMSTTP